MANNVKDGAPQREFASIAEFCQMTSLSRATVYKHLRENRFTAVKFGHRVLIDVAAAFQVIRASPAPEIKSI